MSGTCACMSVHVFMLLQADAQVEMEKRGFYQASMKYVVKLQEVQEKKKFEFVEIVSGFCERWILGLGVCESFCGCVEVQTCKFAYMHMCVCLCICVDYFCVYVSMCVCLCVSLCVSEWVCVCVCVCMCLSVCVCMHGCGWTFSDWSIYLDSAFQSMINRLFFVQWFHEIHVNLSCFFPQMKC